MLRDWKIFVKKFARQDHEKYVVSFVELPIDWNDFVNEQKTKQMPLNKERGKRKA